MGRLGHETWDGCLLYKVIWDFFFSHGANFLKYKLLHGYVHKLTCMYIPAYVWTAVIFHLNSQNMWFLMEVEIKPNKCSQVLLMFQIQYKGRTLLVL